MNNLFKKIKSKIKDLTYQSKFTDVLIMYNVYINSYMKYDIDKISGVVNNKLGVGNAMDTALNQNRQMLDLIRSGRIAKSFFANSLYSEHIMMMEVNNAIRRKVPMEHIAIVESIREISRGIKAVTESYYEHSTKPLVQHTEISKQIRMNGYKLRLKYMEQSQEDDNKNEKWGLQVDRYDRIYNKE